MVVVTSNGILAGVTLEIHDVTVGAEPFCRWILAVDSTFSGAKIPSLTAPDSVVPTVCPWKLVAGPKTKQHFGAPWQAASN